MKLACLFSLALCAGPVSALTLQQLQEKFGVYRDYALAPDDTPEPNIPETSSKVTIVLEISMHISALDRELSNSQPSEAQRIERDFINAEGMALTNEELAEQKTYLESFIQELMTKWGIEEGSPLSEAD